MSPAGDINHRVPCGCLDCNCENEVVVASSFVAPDDPVVCKACSNGYHSTIEEEKLLPQQDNAKKSKTIKTTSMTIVRKDYFVQT